MKTKLIVHLVIMVAFLAVIDGSAFAQIKSNGTGGGAWSSASTWAGGVVPTSSDSVEILGTDSVTCANGDTCASVTLDAGAVLTTTKTNGGTMPATAWTAATTSTVVYHGPSPINAAYPYGNLTYSTVAPGGTSGAVSGDLVVKGDLTVNGVGTGGNNAVRGVDVVDSSVQRIITIMGNVNLTTPISTIVGVCDPLNNAADTIPASCTWNIGGNVNLTGGAASNKFVLFANTGVFSGTATFNISGDLNIGNSSTILFGSQANANLSTGIINLKGNFVQDGPISIPSEKTGSLQVNFVGSTSQGWSGGAGFAISSLKLNVGINNAAGVILDAPIVFNNNTSLMLTKGKLSTDTTNILTVSGTGSISGATASSYVDGPLALTYSDTGSQIFPIGSATAYRPLTLNATAIAGSGTITAMQTDANPGSTSLPAGVESISKVRYFTVKPAAGITALTGNVTLSWGSDDAVNDLSGVTVVEGTHGGAWTTADNSGGTTGTLSAGTVTGNGFTSFNDFVLGFASPVVKSNGTGGGAWSSTSTWQGSVVPTSSDNVEILGADSVTCANGDTCASLTLDAGAVLVTMKTNSGTMPAASWSAATTSTVVYDGPSPISAAYPYGNLTYSTVATGPLSGAVNGNLTVNGDLTVNGAGTSGNNVVRGVDVADSSVQRTITVKGNVNLTTKLASIVAVSDPVNAASNMVTASCTWNIGGNVVLSGNYPVNKLSLFANQGTFTGTATYNINGNLVIGSGSQLLYGTQSNTKPYGTGIINLKGNVIQDGGIIMTNSATSGSLTINLDGSSSQSWSGTDSTFGFTYLTLDVAINNAAGVVLGAPRTFNNNTTLTLTNGKVSTDTTNILMLSGTGNISGASDSSYVDGPLALTYSTTGSQTFPIGSATAYRPLTLNATAITGSGTITALQTDANPGGSILPAGVESISKTRYFTITPAAGIKALTGDVTLSWGQDDSVNNLTEVTVVEGTHGGAWTSANNSGGTTGTLSAGTVTGNGFTSFHDFVLGSTSALPAVPTLVSPATNTTSVPRLATFEWSPVTGATKYEFQVATDSSVYTSGDSATAFKIQDVVFDTTVTAPDTSLHLSVPLSTSTKYYWHVSATSTVGTSGYAKPVAFTTGTGLDAIVGEPNEIPREFTLSQNYPNPFNPTTVIQYALPKVEYVQLNVYNVLGQKVASLVSEPQSAGYHVVNFNADRFASGIYFYVIRAGNFAATRKMLFLK